MRFLSKKNLLVSLLVLSLAACTSTTRTTTKNPPVLLECDGDAGHYNHAVTPIPFQLSSNASSTCDLKDVNFIQDTRENYKFFTKRARPSGDRHVVFDYTGPSQIPGDGAYFFYITQSHNSPSPDGGGGGVIH